MKSLCSKVEISESLESNSNHKLTPYKNSSQGFPTCILRLRLSIENESFQISAKYLIISKKKEPILRVICSETY